MSVDGEEQILMGDRQRSSHSKSGCSYTRSGEHFKSAHTPTRGGNRIAIFQLRQNKQKTGICYFLVWTSCPFRRFDL